MKDQSQSKNGIYKYVLFAGNNSAVIGEALAKRKVWSAIDKDKILSADFVWKPLNYGSQIYENFEEIMRYDKNKSVMLNHFEHNKMICTKSGLVRSLKHYYSHENAIYQQNYHVFQTIPTTFIVNPNKQSAEYKDFLQRFLEIESANFSKQKIPSKHCEKNIWYIKPQALNQGKGINLSSSLRQIQNIIFSKVTNTSYILQKAIQKPLLYEKRKFDVRVWALVTCNLQIYFYKVPYIRTSSYEYNDEQLNQNIHLTNNCQQKHFDQYSKFQQGNTIPFECLKNVLLSMGKTDADDLMAKIIQRMKNLVVDCILSVRKFFLRNIKKKQFELFGFDFLIDEDLRTWLLQVNNNPYLGVPNKFIKQLLPQMINQMLQIVLDPYFPPVDYKPVQNKNYELLHKQVNAFRIMPIRSCSGSMDNKRKDYYPMQDFASNPSKQLSMTKSRRNSEPYPLAPYGSMEKSSKIRYSTPPQTIKALLQSYCFSDYQPFVIPVNFLLTSPKLQQKELMQTNLRNIKLITETRICPILLQPKFVTICTTILQSNKHAQEVKRSLLDGFTNAIKNYKHRSIVIKFIVPTFTTILKMHNRTADPEGNLKQDALIQAIILLLIKLGQIVNRKIFIPGQTREKQNNRHLFIVSNTLKILMNYKENYPSLCVKQIQQLFSNFDEKDWNLYNSVEKGQQNSRQDLSGVSMMAYEKLDSNDKYRRNQLIGNNLDRRLSLRQKVELQYSKNHGMAANNISTLPKIKKLK